MREAAKESLIRRRSRYFLSKSQGRGSQRRGKAHFFKTPCKHTRQLKKLSNHWLLFDPAMTPSQRQALNHYRQAIRRSQHLWALSGFEGAPVDFPDYPPALQGVRCGAPTRTGKPCQQRATVCKAHHPNGVRMGAER